MRTIQIAKREVQEELERRSARIERTVARLKTDFSTPGRVLGRVARNHPYESLFGLVAVGAAATFLVLNRSRNGSAKPGKGRAGATEAYSDIIAAGIREAEQSGLVGVEALHAAIRANPPVVPPAPSKSSTYVRQIIDRFVSTLTAMAFEHATTWLSEMTNRQNRTT